jgi:hypothetical protein
VSAGGKVLFKRPAAKPTTATPAPVPAPSDALAGLAAEMRVASKWLSCTGKEKLLTDCSERPHASAATGWRVPVCSHAEHDVSLRCAGERDRVYAAREDLWERCAMRQQR